MPSRLTAALIRRTFPIVGPAIVFAFSLAAPAQSLPNSQLVPIPPMDSSKPAESAKIKPRPKKTSSAPAPQPAPPQVSPLPVGQLMPGIPVQASPLPSYESATTPAAEATTSMPLKITLTPSETPLKIGSTSNIAANIQNISSKPVLVFLNTMELRTHSIVAASTSRCVLAMTPNYNGSYGNDIVLQPQDQVSVLFNLSQGAAPVEDFIDTPPLNVQATPATSATPVPPMPTKKQLQEARDACDAGVLGPIKRALDFSPGNYDYFFSGYFSLCIQPTDSACRLPVRALALSATFPVGIDQTSIIFFAMIGGWLALLVVTFNDSNKTGSSDHYSPDRPTRSGWYWLWDRLTLTDGGRATGKFFIRFIGVAILSAAFTIVSSRLSDTQLPVKITILDAWGAMTVGFVSYFIGQKFILTLTNWGSTGIKPAAND